MHDCSYGLSGQRGDIETRFCCVLCSGTAFSPWSYECPDYYLHKDGVRVDYVECASCSLVQQYLIPADVSALYADYPVHTSRSPIQRLARHIFHRQVYLRPGAGSAGQDLLDYGCGAGTFLRDMQPYFKTVSGFEPGEAHAMSLRQRLNLPVYSSMDALRSERPGAFDVVTAHFVVEHVNDLHDTFSTFSSVLKRGGVLYMAVPNIRSWEAHLFKRKWHGLDAPRHLVFPQKKHFESLAARYGFDTPRLGYAAFPNTLAASLATCLTGRCHPLLLTTLVPFCWPVALLAPQGTIIVKMNKF